MISLTIAATFFAVVFVAELLQGVVHVVIAVAAADFSPFCRNKAVITVVLFAVGAFLMLRPGAEAESESEDEENTKAVCLSVRGPLELCLARGCNSHGALDEALGDVVLAGGDIQLTTQRTRSVLQA